MRDTTKLKLLIVDDEDGMRRTLRRIMFAKGFDVEVASDGEEAVRVAETYTPDVVLLDMKMPGMNGVEAYRRIKPLCPAASAIFMTAYASSHLSQEACDAGATEVLAKPVDIDALLAAIKARA